MELLTTAEPWTDRRRRASELVEAYPHAAEMLRLYLALMDAWEPGLERLRDTPPAAGEVAAVAVRELLPAVLEATLAAGPKLLGEGLLRRFHEADLEGLVKSWLAGEELSSVDRYLARASAGPLLESMPRLATAPQAPADEGHCPACGGLPQLAFFGISGESLVSAPRRLLCSRCGQSWIYPRMVCAGCGSEDTARLPIYSDSERFAGLRIDACEACRRYLVTVDLPKDPAAVPVVDELAAVPLDLFARERGFQKIAPNLMGL